MRILKNIGGVRGRESISRLIISGRFYFVYVNILFRDNIKKLVFVASYLGDLMFNEVWKPVP